MNEAVELILKRMDSHPDEWCDEWATSAVAPQNRWANVMYQVRSRLQELGRISTANEPKSLAEGPYPCYLPFLSDDECEAIYLKHVKLQGQAFEKFVIATVCGVDTPEATDEYDTFAGHAAQGTGTLSGALRTYAKAKGAMG